MHKEPVEVLIKKRKISEIVNPRLVQASSSIPIRQAVELMQEQRSGYIVIADDRNVVGIFTETDVVRKLLGKDVDWSRPVREVMTKDPMVLKLADTVGTVIDVMGGRRLYYVPLVDDERKLVGVISVRTLIRFLAEFYPGEIYNLPPKPGQITKTEEGG